MNTALTGATRPWDDGPEEVTPVPAIDKTRHCECGTKLSRYNLTKACEACRMKAEQKALAETTFYEKWEDIPDDRRGKPKPEGPRKWLNRRALHTRREIVTFLDRAGQASYGAICAATGYAHSTIKQHMREMRAEGTAEVVKNEWDDVNNCAVYEWALTDKNKAMDYATGRGRKRDTLDAIVEYIANNPGTTSIDIAQCLGRSACGVRHYLVELMRDGRLTKKKRGRIYCYWVREG